MKTADETTTFPGLSEVRITWAHMDNRAAPEDEGWFPLSLEITHVRLDRPRRIITWQITRPSDYDINEDLGLASIRSYRTQAEKEEEGE